MQITRQNVREAFRHKPPSTERAKLHAEIDRATADLADMYLKICATPSPELTLALRALQQARMWVNTALAHHDPTVEVASEPSA